MYILIHILKSSKDDMKDVIIAKLASQVSHLYDIAYETASNDPEVTKLLGQVNNNINYYYRCCYLIIIIFKKLI